MLANDFFTDGPYFISGNRAGHDDDYGTDYYGDDYGYEGGMFPMISIKYQF